MRDLKRGQVSMRAPIAFLITIVLTASTICIPTSPAYADACGSGGMYRPGDNNGSATFELGIAGQIFVPAASNITGLNGAQSATDVFLFNTNGSFVQVGWVDGRTTDINTSGQVHFFFGQYDANAPLNSEDLFDLGSASQGFHSFQILYHASIDRFDYYIDGAVRGRTSIHESGGRPGVVSEASYLCTTVLGDTRRDPEPPYETLYWYDSSGTNHPFVADRPSAPTGFFSVHWQSTDGTDETGNS